MAEEHPQNPELQEFVDPRTHHTHALCQLRRSDTDPEDIPDVQTKAWLPISQAKNGAKVSYNSAQWTIICVYGITVDQAGLAVYRERPDAEPIL